MGTLNDMVSNKVYQTDTGKNKIQSFAGSPFVIAVSVCVLLCVVFAVSKTFDWQKSFEIELESQINPNKAPPASLVRLPGIGVGLAGAIVDYRENFSGKGGKRPAFETIDDLQKVRGIGPKKAESMKEWLKFE